MSRSKMNRSKQRTSFFGGVLSAALFAAVPAVARSPGHHHVHLTTSNATEAVKWYTEHLGCQPIEDRGEAVDCGTTEIEFIVRPTLGGSPGTGVDHIGFSFADLDAKMAELEAVGVRGSGVRLQRFEDGAMVRDVPGLFKIAFIFDPWGTRIELVEDPETLGFHHIHLRSPDPEATLAWYQDVFGGEKAKLRDRIDGLRYGDVWFLFSRYPEGQPAPTEGRSIDHLGFVLADLGDSAGKLRQKGVTFLSDPEVPANARAKAKQAFLLGPDSVRIAVVEPGWAGVVADRATESEPEEVAQEPYEVPRLPWGEPDLQGVWTGDAAHGIPLERPDDVSADEAVLSAEQAAARRERSTLGSIWGYDREWRDTTLGYVKTKVSRQVAMVIDPPDGRLPPRAKTGKRAAPEERPRRGRSGNRYGSVEGPEDLPTFVRCITRGPVGIMMPGIYNNGLQIVQSPGYVALQKEMIHETRVIPTTPRPHLSSKLTQWLGDSRAHWEGDTLVVEVTNFNGKTSYRGSSKNMKVTERFTRIGPTTLEYQFTIDDPEVWTQPWTGMFHFEKDDSQYELVEYACHEGNYGMMNILSGARAREAAGEDVQVDVSTDLEDGN